MREFRELVGRLVDACNRGVAMKASGDWKALRAHERRLARAIKPLRSVVEVIQSDEAPASENGHQATGPTPPAEMNGHVAAVPAPPPGAMIADLRRQLDAQLSRGGDS